MSDTSRVDFNIGVIEGFFGRSWSWRDRADFASFLADSAFRFYIYAPKDDAFLRKNWRLDWPNETRDQLSGLADAYQRRGLEFGLGLSPYEIYLDYGAETKGKLRAKVESLNALGPDILCVLFDDMRGELPKLAQVQADIVHHVADHTTASRLILCPTYYSFDPVLENVFGEMPPDYLRDIGRLVDRKIDIFWTGPLVCSNEYPESHLREVAALLRRKPFLWDNYPVNDGAKMSQFLHLGAFENRSQELRALTAGHAVNPMNQAWLSRIPLRTLPMSYARGGEYAAEAAFAEVCGELCGAELATHLTDDLQTFQQVGLCGMDSSLRQALVTKYGAYRDNPYAQEVVAWLNGEYEFDPACLTG